jgi:hypothetical protein
MKEGFPWKKYLLDNYGVGGGKKGPEVTGLTAGDYNPRQVLAISFQPSALQEIEIPARFQARLGNTNLCPAFVSAI